MTLAQFLSILRARKWAALGVFAVVVLATLIISLVLPKQYSAVSTVVLDVKTDLVATSPMPVTALTGFMATQADILQSDRVTQRVIRDLKLLDSPQIRQQWQDEAGGQGTIEQWLSDIFKKKLDIKPSRDSFVIEISYQAPDPKFAAALANAYAQAYIATTLELRVDPAKQFTTFFETQSKDAREALERTQTRLSAFQRQKGIIATDERMDVESNRLNELSTTLVQMQAVATESASRQAQASGGTGDRMQEVLMSPTISNLKIDLARNEAKLQELSERLGESHPQVIETKASIAELRGRLDAETKRITSGVTVTNTINKQREVQIARALEAQRAKVLQMKAVRDEGQVLQRELENAQRAYDTVAQRLSAVGLEAVSTSSYARVLTAAQPPVEVSSPKVVLNTALAVVLGAMLAIGLALILELTDHRIRGVDDVLQSIGLPVLGTIPKPTAKRFVSGNRALPMAQQPIGLPAPAQGV